jgi:hypothetical protein
MSSNSWSGSHNNSSSHDSKAPSASALLSAKPIVRAAASTCANSPPSGSNDSS